MRFAAVSDSNAGLHVAVIMDGNGRWGVAHSKGRCEGHRAGADNVRRIVEAAPQLGIRALSLYAFSRDNWTRPPEEVKNLLGLMREFLDAERERCRRDGVRIHVIGSRQRLDAALLRSIVAAENATVRGTRLDLRIALDYSSRESILAAAKRYLARPRNGVDGLAHFLAGDGRGGGPVSNVDLLIRTGGEQRLSDFLLWECAYAELYFTPVFWPDFTPRDLELAVSEFRRRERRFGQVGAATSEGKDYWLR